MKKKVLSVLLVAAMAMSMLTGCSLCIMHDNSNADRMWQQACRQ